MIAKYRKVLRLRSACFAIGSQSLLSFHYRWDTLTGNLELVEQIDGHSDIVYGSFDPKYFKRSESEAFLLNVSLQCLG